MANNIYSVIGVEGEDEKDMIKLYLALIVISKLIYIKPTIAAVGD